MAVNAIVHAYRRGGGGITKNESSRITPQLEHIWSKVRITIGDDSSGYDSDAGELIVDVAFDGNLSRVQVSFIWLVAGD